MKVEKREVWENKRESINMTKKKIKIRFLKYDEEICFWQFKWFLLLEKKNSENEGCCCKNCLRFLAGDGNNIFLWLDWWHPDGILFEKYGYRVIYEMLGPSSLLLFMAGNGIGQQLDPRLL